jgi:uncharacterized phage protein (TIGR01671 family)
MIMRDVLFRGKRKDNGEWVEGSLLYDGEQNEAYIAECFEDRSAYIREVIPETVGQYTGLTDKNGKKIFEVDIVRYPDSEMFASCEEAINEGVVDWDEEVMCFYFTNRFVVDMADFDIENGRMIDVEVIGNIHDNPELLKGGAE